VTNSNLAESYLEMARAKLSTLNPLIEQKAYPVVVREAQEIVELALKAMLREGGVEPPKHHDVGPFILEYKDKFKDEVRIHLEKLAQISSWLRSERELSFYGDVDFIPTVQYKLDDAERAYHDAGFVVEIAGKAISRAEKK
jgi:HEPN domain-containing protein